MPLADFEDLLKQAIGLDAASVGSATIERAIQLRMAVVGLIGLEDYWQLTSNSNHELQELVEAVVVAETWFFRDREAFAALTYLVTEEWRPASSVAVLRMLSIPCCTGEEPYSMVMALVDSGFSPDQLSVDAVDVSAQALAVAKRGVYGSNSFRGEDLTFRDCYFERVANGFAVAPSIAKRVNFRLGNLLSSGDESVPPYDVIFCRNLLIYFDRAKQEQAMKILSSLLTPSGLLFVGSAEAFLAGCHGFRPVNRPMSFAFRKSPAKRLEPATPTAAPARKRVQSPQHVQPRPSMKPMAPSPAPLGDLQTARRMADLGQLREASERCEDYLRQHGPSTDAYFLMGLIKDAAGDAHTAAELYRRVVYLEPEHVEGLMHLALLVECQGDPVTAERLRKRARRIEHSRSSQ